MPPTSTTSPAPPTSGDAGVRPSPALNYDGDLKHLADHVESVPRVEVLSLGHALEIIKDLGDANTVAADYRLDDYFGSHGIGHVRMATESDVDISNDHPY